MLCKNKEYEQWNNKLHYSPLISSDIRSNCFKFLDENLKHVIHKNGHKHKENAYLDPFIFFFYQLRVKTLHSEKIELQGLQINDPAAFSTQNLPTIERLQDEFPQRAFRKLYQFREKILNFNPFAGKEDPKWDLRISKERFKDIFKIYALRAELPSLATKIKKLTPQQQLIKERQDLIDLIYQVSTGNFTEFTQCHLEMMCFNDAFYLRQNISKEELIDPDFEKKLISLAINIVPRRVPIVTHQGELKGFRFIQYLELIPYFSKKEWMLKENIRQNIIQKFKGDNDKYHCFNPNIILNNLNFEKRRLIAFKSVETIVDVKTDKTLGFKLYEPKTLEKLMLSQEQVVCYKQLQNGKFHNPKEFLQTYDKFKRANDNIVDVVQDEKGAEQLLRFIKSIPQLKFRLTPEQDKMISTPNNLLCLGRSGTGKTSCSALRLFSTDVFYKYMEDLNRFKDDNPGALNQHFKIDPNFLNKKTMLRLVFVTFSPVLTNEVKKFYNDSKDHVTKELVKRKARHNHSYEEMKSYEIIETKTQAMEDQDIQEYLKIEEKFIDDDMQLDNQIKLPHSIDELSSDNFPLFVTVKRLVYMLDASLEHSFFSRDTNGQIIGMENSVEWHNENKGVFRINQYYKEQKNYDAIIGRLGTKLLKIDEKLDFDDMVDINEEEQNPLVQDFSGVTNLSKAFTALMKPSFRLINSQLSQEIDYDMFKNKFWPKVAASANKLSSLIVWTEIYSVIKGGSQACQYYDCILPLSLYVGFNRSNKKEQAAAAFLDDQEKLQVYQIFLTYEKWKSNRHGYDFNDVVNHVIQQMRAGVKSSQKIHFLMVDEVQDLTPNVLYLLTSVTERNIFFCGDTAQTISKGIGFRFYDLKSIFTSTSQIQVPSVLQLSKNFRSHKRILSLANSVVSLLELLFPKTIDKFNKESSDLEGPKPIFIDECKDSDLQKLLIGQANQNLTQDISDSQMNLHDAPQFGCNQVIIVRDQESKKHLPDFLKNMLCLTVYEAKGLEFEEVIIFNFFQDSKCEEQWKYLRELEFVLKTAPIRQDIDFSSFESLDAHQVSQDQSISSDNKDLSSEQSWQECQYGDELNIELKMKDDMNLVYRKCAQLCTEFKFLYVAITRAKNVLIIIDQDDKFRKPLQEMWAKMQIIDVVTKDMTQNRDLLPLQIQKILKQGKSTQQFSKDKWKLQGILLFKKKIYSQAQQCFKNSGDEELYLRCLAYSHTDEATKNLSEYQSLFNQSKIKALQKAETNSLRKEAREHQKQAAREFKYAGKYFSQIGMKRHAAQAYCSAKMYDQALTLFEEIGEFGQAAQCCVSLDDFQQAAKFYTKAKMLANAFECYERIEEWEQLLMCLYKNKDQFKQEEREALIEKYFPIALNHLYTFYSSINPLAALNTFDEENRGKLQEMKIKQKYQKNVSVIQEEGSDSDLESSSSSEEESKFSMGSNRFQVQKSQILEDNSQVVEQINTCTEDNNEFSNNYNDYQDQDYNYQQQDIEVLSMIDPEDTFLNLNKSNGSIIESLASQPSQSFSIISSQTSSSQFSIIGSSQVASIVKLYNTSNSTFRSRKTPDSLGSNSKNTPSSASKYSIIEFERDSYIEDIIMQKIIYYVSLFSDEVQGRLKTICKKNHNVSQKKGKPQKVLIDLDNINRDLLYLILDTLEHYELYKLCIIICNRYKLKDKMLRFLVSIGNKYSNLKQMKYTFLSKFKTQKLIDTQQTYSLLVHEAMHNVFSLMEKDFLNDKSTQKSIEDNYFDYFFMQGFWKKILFLIDPYYGMELSFIMNDFESFKMLFLITLFPSQIKDHEKLQQLIQKKAFDRFLDLAYQTKVVDLGTLADEVYIYESLMYLKNQLEQGKPFDIQHFRLLVQRHALSAYGKFFDVVQGQALYQ